MNKRKVKDGEDQHGLEVEKFRLIFLRCANRDVYS